MLSLLDEGSHAYAFLHIIRAPCLTQEWENWRRPPCWEAVLSNYLSACPIGCTSQCFLFVLLITNLGVITGHGICSCGRCICQDGWFGKLCQHSRKCNMTEEESRSLCESADGILCSGKGKNWQLSHPMSVPLQRKTIRFWKTNVLGCGLSFSNPFFQSTCY